MAAGMRWEITHRHVGEFVYSDLSIDDFETEGSRGRRCCRAADRRALARRTGVGPSRAVGTRLRARGAIACLEVGERLRPWSAGLALSVTVVGVGSVVSRAGHRCGAAPLRRRRSPPGSSVVVRRRLVSSIGMTSDRFPNLARADHRHSGRGVAAATAAEGHPSWAHPPPRD